VSESQAAVEREADRLASAVTQAHLAPARIGITRSNQPTDLLQELACLNRRADPDVDLAALIVEPPLQPSGGNFSIGSPSRSGGADPRR
jgi:hypothetical protein